VGIAGALFHWIGFDPSSVESSIFQLFDHLALICSFLS